MAKKAVPDLFLFGFSPLIITRKTARLGLGSSVEKNEDDGKYPPKNDMKQP